MGTGPASCAACPVRSTTWISRSPEAEYFLGRLRAPGCRQPEIDYLLSAYASATRSITLAMKAVLADTGGFAEWYAIREQRLKGDPRGPVFSSRWSRCNFYR